MNKLLIAIITIATSVVSCKMEVDKTEGTANTQLVQEQSGSIDKNEVEYSAIKEVKTMELAHGKASFLSQDVVSFKIKLSFNGAPRLDGRISMSTDSRQVLINKNDGSTIYYDGEDVWFTGESSNDQKARFDALTWSYFFALPFKISDQGTQIEKMDSNSDHLKYNLSFESEVGDTPDDWYHLYIDRETHLLSYAGYIVTYGDVDPEQAAENAHAIEYLNYNTVENISLPSIWKFYNYDKDIDRSKVIGEAEISQIKFGTFNDHSLEKPDGAYRISLD